MTLPAASPPLWPSSSTTRVLATLSAKRIMVAINSTAGNIPNSSGFMVYTVTSNTTNASAILNENNISSRNGGSGKITMPSAANTKSGVPTPFAYSFLSLLSCCNTALNSITLQFQKIDTTLKLQ